MAMKHRPPGAVDSMKEVDEDTLLEVLQEEPLNQDTQQESEEIDISEKVKEEETVMIDFEAGDFSDHFAGKKTIDSQQEKTNEQGKTLGGDEVREQIREYEAGKSRSQTFADFQQTSEFILNLIDMLWSNSMKWFAKDSTSAAYQLSKGDLRKLIDPLAMVLAKHSAKFAIEWIFIVGIVAAYSGSFAKAKRRRDELSGKRKPDGTGDKSEFVQEAKEETLRQEDTISHQVENPIPKKPYKRGRGRASKA